MQDELLRVLSLASFAAFAVGGVVASRQRRADIIGAYIIANTASFGGGIIRDAILGIPAIGPRDPVALATVFIAATAAMFLPRAFARWTTVVDVLDAIGIGLFNAIGMSIAWSQGVHPGLVLLLGSVTAAGGGVICDVLLGRMPIVMQHSTLFVTACQIGGIVGLAAHALGLGPDAVGLLIAAVTTGVRLLAMRFGWTLQALWDPAPLEPGKGT
jgi:uncharacterized membrane protein YeiH